MADWIHYIPSLLFGLIVSFLLAKLFSFVFSSGDDHFLTSTTPTNPNHHHRHHHNKSPLNDTNAEFSRSQNELLLIHRHNKLPQTDIDDDDWEGVETTELEQAFCAATAFVAAIAADRSSLKVSSSLQLKLYGLYMIATDGVCNVPQPSAIKITARAKWNAWRKLGDMSHEDAMQKYLEIITQLYPTWADGSTFNKRVGHNNETSSKDTKPMGPDFSSLMHEEESGNELKLDAAREGDADNLLKCDSEGQMPLAVDHDHIDVAEKTSSKKENDGETPLCSAAVGELGEIGASLVKHNAATGIQDDDDGKHPSDMSDSNWHSVQT
ncbi:hypothetical protein QVD17_30943 [Tagetes erecta]|uniref:ACB domain-containing protein n=1 Tax=Tagetes erecta TaxID=13708 RepID=A0AAD8NNR6_TARER|nr:hypothetical protein QVD17_30943 [Tagetes erecta]